MANIKLGAIITEIAGSVGGSTFRRTPAGIILYNKQGTQIKSAFAAASVKNKLGNVFAAWQLLNSEEKAFFNYQATLYTFPDKFGELKFLTGRQLFTKLNTQLIPANLIVDISKFSSLVYPGVVEGLSINFASEELIAEFSEPLDKSLVMIKCYPRRKGAGVKPHAHFKNTYLQAREGASNVNFYTEFRSQYPLAEIGTTWGANITFMNTSGFQTSVQAFEFTL